MSKVPLMYPKMPGSASAPLSRCLAFEKYDGTNLHWGWDREFGWITFGTRRDSFYLDGQGIPAFYAAHPGLEEAVELFQRDYAEPLERIFQSNERYRDANSIVAFTEYFGAQSFAGMHKANDPKKLMLFDVQHDGQMLPPEVFVEDFASVKIARVVYRGKLTGKFADDMRQGKYDVAEGVVCKGTTADGVWMVKIKTHAYMERLQRSFHERWQDYWE